LLSDLWNANGVAIGQKNYLPEQLTVLVTGAASGIGLAQANQFLKEGHCVFAVDLLTQDHIFQNIKKEFPNTFDYALADVSHPKNVESVIAQLKIAFGGLHVLCNTAGKLDEYRSINETSFDYWNKIIRNNIDSVFLMMKNVLPLLLKNPSSRIINMSSIAGLSAGGGGISYTAAKHAIVGMTKQMAYDYSDQGLKVNAIAPGAIATRMNEKDFTENKGAMAKWVANETPVKRWATPEEIAELTLFLASDKADYIQGTVIPVDGGWMNR